ncbi:MAG TPA: hypothetical protein ENJ82_10855, partial [Bacteroidetes bacterium]|nr:hypothetical protein [Bacteroidota bacterium]
SFWTGGRLGLTWLKDGVYRDTTYAKAKIWALLEDQDSSLWLGTLTGLRKVDRQGRLLPQAKHSVLQKRVSALDQLPDGRLVVGTLGAGLLVVDGDSILQIGTGLGLNTNLVNCVAIDSGGRIWVGSGRGLNRVVVNHLEPPKVESLNRGNGLPFQEVQQIDIHGNKVWLAGPQGLSVIDQNAWHKRSVLPPIHLLRIGINGRDTLPLAKVEVSHRQNYLSFSFLGLRFRRNGPLNYRYRLGGLDHDWRYTQDTTVSYPALPPGTYTFEVAAQNEAGEWSIPAAKAVILVLKPYWQKWWFIMLVILAMLVLGVGITYYFIRQGRNRLHREKNLEKWKMKALRARMDPHFIFNTLNTIQAYISTHDTIAAEKYLNKFARLVRKVMHQSSEETISLADEREMLELYLALEEMRFSGIFTYKIHWDPALNADLVQIPGMLVQPFVENAILHGLLPKKKGGKVVITFKAAGSHIFCTIEDDGIGRVAARKLNRAQHKLHKSAGLDLVRSRLKLLTS